MMNLFSHLLKCLFEFLSTLKVGGVNRRKMNMFGYVTNVTFYLLCLKHKSFCSINIH